MFNHGALKISTKSKFAVNH
uniref:Uncharacterized protein n=1 Tax=Rhizophora mucronata TaxID=61149 RepID=A0A2P2NY88_RHIMU